MVRELQVKVALSEVHDRLWRDGRLAWKLKPHQRTIYETAGKMLADKRATYLNCARKLGKSTISLVMALEHGLQNKAVDIPFIGPTQKQVETYLLPILDLLCADAPAGYRPEWHDQKKYIYLPSSGSRIHVCGTDNRRFEALRGPQYPFAIIDEAGSCDALSYILTSIINPAGSRCRGVVLVASTPPVEMDHDLIPLWETAKEDCTYICFTIDADPSLDEAEKKILFDKAGGIDSVAVQREYYCRIVKDARTTVIPEWDEAMEAKCFRDVKIPDYYHSCGALDPGTKDGAGYVCGYYDFKTGEYVITGEYFAAGKTTVDIATGIQLAEGGIRIEKRVSDTQLQTILDLNALHNVKISPVQKAKTKEAGVNYLRVIVKSSRLVISKNCPVTARQLRTATWESNRDDWKRTERDKHFDCLAACIYWVRSIDTINNPYPEIPESMRWKDYHSRSGLRAGEVRADTGWDKLSEVL